MITVVEGDAAQRRGQALWDCGDYQRMVVCRTTKMC